MNGTYKTTLDMSEGVKFDLEAVRDEDAGF
jgi:hypothetical protein